MTNIELRQIFYDENTYRVIESPAIPLDNTTGPRDWFEFWPILKFLYNHELKSSYHYGFFSPKFQQKTGYTINEVMDIVKKNNEYDLIIFSHSWELLSYYKNPWEYGETVHPGIIDETQKFLNHAGISINLNSFTTCCKNSFYSNYVVANKKYWDNWFKLCLSFYNYTELSSSKINSLNTIHNRKKNYPLKVFIQERLPAILLAIETYKTTNFVKNYNDVKWDFKKTPQNIEKLKLCDFYKEQFIEKGKKVEYLGKYEKIKKTVLLENLWFNYMTSKPFLIKKFIALLNLLTHGRFQERFEKKRNNEYLERLN